jgi:hypothetical protein
MPYQYDPRSGCLSLLPDEAGQGDLLSLFSTTGSAKQANDRHHRSYYLHSFRSTNIPADVIFLDRRKKRFTSAKWSPYATQFHQSHADLSANVRDA